MGNSFLIASKDSMFGSTLINSFTKVRNNGCLTMKRGKIATVLASIPPATLSFDSHGRPHLHVDNYRVMTQRKMSYICIALVL